MHNTIVAIFFTYLIKFTSQKYILKQNSIQFKISLKYLINLIFRNKDIKYDMICFVLRTKNRTEQGIAD